MRTEWWRRIAIGSAVMLGITFAHAQVGPVFEVARVPASGRWPTADRLVVNPQKVAFQATQLGDIIGFAYGFPMDRVDGRPQWMYDDYFDVAVTTPAPATLAEQRLLMQKLLEDRFGLVVHRLSQEGLVYEMVAGPDVRLQKADEPVAEELIGFHPAPRPPFKVGELVPVSALGVSTIGRHVSMTDLACWLYPSLRVRVLDKTGITGYFDLEISGLPLRGGADGTIPVVEKALGLKLEPHRGTVETLIIDRAEELRAD